MLRLKRVEISGFKSFYEKVDLSFPASVTAVVGPNGCGKSNISDAVAWALGEQSARALRGERMDDVIFNGSAKRRPLGMAEVVLTLSASNGDSERGEDGTLRVGRRVYRDGEGEYFLNDKQVRLRDIQDQLLGTGLGVRAYSVIEQGRIDQVLSTKPQDRRRLIEEAAGITRYKLKKRLAETKLEETRGNLLRLSDIVTEIERNVTSLRRQASRAARYKEQSELLRQRRGALMRARADLLRETLRTAEALREERRDREAHAAAALARAEAQLAAARLEASEAAARRDALREELAVLESAIARDDALLESNRRAAADLAARKAALEREGQDFTAEQSRAMRELTDLEERLSRSVAEARAKSLAREEADRRAAEAAALCAALEKELEDARTRALTAAGERVAARNARHEVDLAAERVAASLTRLGQAAQKIAAELAAREADAAEAEAQAQRLRSAADEATGNVRAIEAELASIAERLMHAEGARDTARESAGALEHRHAALLEILRARDVGVTAVRQALSGAGLSERGPLSDRIRPSAGWEDAVGRMLGSDADALLASGNVLRAVDALRTLAAGRIVRDDWRQEVGHASPPAESLGWESVLEGHTRLSLAERAALPPAAFVESIAEALALAERHPGIPFVTRAGEVVRGPVVRVADSAASAASLFALRREEEALRGKLHEARRAFQEVEANVEGLRADRQQRDAALPRLRDLEREAQGLQSAFSARLEERRSERDRLRRERDTVDEEQRALAEQTEGFQAGRRALEDEERRHADAETGAHERIGALSASLAEARSLAMGAAEELAHRRTEAEVAAERRRAMEAARDALRETQSTLTRRLAEASEEETRITARAAELSQEEIDARERQKQNLASRQAKAAEHSRAVESAWDIGASVETAEAQTRTERATLDAAREGRFEAEVSATRVASDLEHVESQARDEFGVAPDALDAPPDASPEGLATLEAEVAELTASLERLGPVNVLAFEEHKEMSERLTFLTAQRDDLLRSMAELQESIRKINATSSERFAEAFHAINANFKEMFARLFQGGIAEMKLLDDNDLLESGIEIDAHPPGKRNQSILLLSGGEKALTAIALLMAIFRYKPSPFCILDEVDAPLDEANIDRFTRLLREMTEETQFIAITHNKRTMETADVMYGVTMEEPGCSKIVSVKFD